MTPANLVVLARLQFAVDFKKLHFCFRSMGAPFLRAYNWMTTFLGIKTTLVISFNKVVLVFGAFLLLHLYFFFTVNLNTHKNYFLGGQEKKEEKNTPKTTPLFAHTVFFSRNPGPHRGKKSTMWYGRDSPLLLFKVRPEPSTKVVSNQICSFFSLLYLVYFQPFWFSLVVLFDKPQALPMFQ